MNDTIIRTLEKHMSGGVAEYQIGFIKKHMRAKEWVFPSGHGGVLYDLCREWADMGLMCRKTIPFWRNGTLQRMRTEFWFDPELNYDEINTQRP